MIISSSGIIPKEEVPTFVTNHCKNVHDILRACGKKINVNSTNYVDIVQAIVLQIARNIPDNELNANFSITTMNYDFPTIRHKIINVYTDKSVEIDEIV
jgi:hypothetical protein